MAWCKAFRYHLARYLYKAASFASTRQMVAKRKAPEKKSKCRVKTVLQRCAWYPALKVPYHCNPIAAKLAISQLLILTTFPDDNNL